MATWTPAGGSGPLIADICVVGAGPAGSLIARATAEAGADVLLIESGARSGGRPGGGDIVGHPMAPLTESRGGGIGGTSLMWSEWDSVEGDSGWDMRPLDRSDLVERAGGYAGWPITGDELAQWYDRVPGTGYVRSVDFAVESPAAPPPLDLDPAVVRSVLFRRGDRHFGDLFAEPSSTPRILTDTTCVGLVSDRSGARVVGMEAVGPGGTRLTVSASTFVLATGGVENARLLLLGDERHPRGFGNQSDHLGRHFNDKLGGWAGLVELKAPVDDRLYRSHRSPLGDLVHARLALAPEVLVERQLPNVAFRLVPRSRLTSSPFLRRLVSTRLRLDRRPRPSLGELARATVALPGDLGKGLGLRGPLLELKAQGEQVPAFDSRLRLGPARDDHNVPPPVVDWRVSTDDLARVDEATRVLGEHLERRGIGRLAVSMGDIRPPFHYDGYHHHNGTTRMAKRAEEGVVDPDSRVFGLDNLFVAGSSVFPRSGFANPTLTILALSLRLAHHLAEAGGRGREATGAPAAT